VESQPDSGEKSEHGKKFNTEGWPPKSFSPDDVESKRDSWVAEAGQIYEDLNWETDEDVGAIYGRANTRLEKLGDQYTFEKHQQIMADETDRYVMDNPDEAEKYKGKWEQWAEVAGVDKNINDAEWRQLALLQPGVTYMGQYRSIAQAVYRRT